jgi:hypothetical protein
MVPGEDPESARVDGEALAETELEREVGDQKRRAGTQLRGPVIAVAVGGGQRRLDRRPGAVPRRFFDGGRTHALEQGDGVVMSLIPEPGVEGLERVPDPRVPAPGQIECQVAKLVQQPGRH